MANDDVEALRASTNPKDSLGALKVSFAVCPSVARIYWALAMMDGAEKYGEMNWRNKSVKMSVYLDAMDRHLTQLRAGEDLDVDPVTGAVVPHTGRIMACASIIEDARASGNLIDDRRANDRAAIVLASLTQQTYTSTARGLTRTPGRTIDDERGGPIKFDEFVTAIADGLKNFAAAKKEREANANAK